MFTPVGFFRLVVAVASHIPWLVGWVGRRAIERGPLVDVPLASITRVEHVPRWGYSDRIAITTADARYVFAGGWYDWAPLLDEVLVDVLGMEIFEEDVDRWRVEPRPPTTERGDA